VSTVWYYKHVEKNMVRIVGATCGKDRRAQLWPANRDRLYAMACSIDPNGEELGFVIGRTTNQERR